MKNVCSYCRKKDCIPDVAFLNCEMYGNSGFIVKCNYCQKVLDIIMERKVVLLDIKKSNKKSEEADW